MILASSFWLAGCGLFGGGEKNQIDPPKEVSLVEDQSHWRRRAPMEK